MPISTPVTASTTAILNHLLRADKSAAELLARHAGSVVHVNLLPQTMAWQILPNGQLANISLASDTPPSVTITVDPANVPRILQDKSRAVSYVNIAGDAELASVIAKVSQSLRWDAEYDLSRIVGDVAAVRLLQAVKSGWRTAQDAHQRLQQNVAEYLTEEQSVLTPRYKLEELTQAVTVLRDDTERLMKRLDKLKAKI